MNDKATGASGEVITGARARRAAMQMDVGNIVSMILPVPLAMLWFGLSILVYALHRHHPNPKVGRYTQWAAYRFYGVVGSLVPIATFYSDHSLKLWLWTWAICAAVLVPSSIWALIRIYRDEWVDIMVPASDDAEGPRHD